MALPQARRAAMLDFGWMEFLIIMAVAVLVIGPREIPQLMYSLGKVMRRLHYLRYALSSQFEDFMAEAELRRNQQNVPDETHQPDDDDSPGDTRD
jgi:sec-independent protein translocase protein TatB